MVALLHYEISYDAADLLSRKLAIREDTIDRLSEAAQTIGSICVLTCEIADGCSRIRIAKRQLGEDQVFLGMMVYLRVDFEIADNRSNNLIVGATAALKELKFPLKDSEEQINIAMLSAQKIDNHCSAFLRGDT